LGKVTGPCTVLLALGFKVQLAPEAGREKRPDPFFISSLMALCYTLSTSPNVCSGSAVVFGRLVLERRFCKGHFVS